MTDEQVIERAMELVRCAGLGLDRDGGPDLRAALDLLREVAGTPGAGRPAPEPDEPGLDLSGDEELPAVVERWCADAGPPVDDFRRARREFLRGDHVPMAFPVSAVSRVACRRLRELGALPVGHRVSVVWSDDRPSVTLPVRVPVWTAVALPKRPVVLASQYLHHELGHVLELSRRPASWPLLRRWRVPSVVTETVAIAVESLGRDAGWLAGLGVADERAHVTAVHCRHENDYTRAYFSSPAPVRGSPPDRARRPAAVHARPGHVPGVPPTLRRRGQVQPAGQPAGAGPLAGRVPTARTRPLTAIGRAGQVRVR